MPCYHPISAFRSDEVNDSGKRSIIFSKVEGRVFSLEAVQIPCGKCIGCRLDRSRQWAIRCVHEAELYERNCFITLTYNKDFLPDNDSLKKADFQNFIKRLRKSFKGLSAVDEIKNNKKTGRVIYPIRFYMCGEYGERCGICGLNKTECFKNQDVNNRHNFKSVLGHPHYHACLFNFDFEDKVLWSIRDNVRLYRSANLEKLWPFGYSTIGDVNFESAGYVARYIMKKQYKNKNDKDYLKNYYGDKVMEYTTMSRSPGVAFEWYRRNKDFIYSDDSITMQGGFKVKPPKYYDTKYDLTNSEDLSRIKEKRTQDMLADIDNVPVRLKTKESIKNRKLALLKRGL